MTTNGTKDEMRESSSNDRKAPGPQPTCKTIRGARLHAVVACIVLLAVVDGAPRSAAAQGASFGAERIVSVDVPGTVDAHPADLDRDGDMDVVSAARGDLDAILWFENTGGDNPSFTRHVITSGESNVNEPSSVHAADLTGDGFLEVLSTSAFAPEKVAWYANSGDDDGDGTIQFGSQRIIADGSDMDQPESVHAADFDGDGDQDVIAASFEDDKVGWYENMDGNGTFSSQRLIAVNTSGERTVDGPLSVYAADVDRDGHMDALSASARDSKITWYENSGSTTGSRFQPLLPIASDANTAVAVRAADIDGDGDVDVASASSAGGGDASRVAWHESMDVDGDPATDDEPTWTTHDIDTETMGAVSVALADLDGDGDLDALSASSFEDDNVAWYENTGGADLFSNPKVIASKTQSSLGGNPQMVDAADLDGDGFRDVIVAWSGDDSVTWYKNQCQESDAGCTVLDRCPDDDSQVDDEDTDGDGTLDCNDECPGDPNKIREATCGCNVPDEDTDGDGTLDCNDECPNDSRKTSPGTCGCGTPDTDTDDDGAICDDECPEDPNKTMPGTCGCGTPDTDTDDDGATCNDECPEDPNKTMPGTCGCGTPDTDTDDDGTLDCNDECPMDPNDDCADAGMEGGMANAGAEAGVGAGMKDAGMNGSGGDGGGPDGSVGADAGGAAEDAGGDSGSGGASMMEEGETQGDAGYIARPELSCACRIPGSSPNERESTPHWPAAGLALLGFVAWQRRRARR